MVMVAGCSGTKENTLNSEASNILTKMQSQLARIENSEFEKEETTEGIFVTLHHAIFEPTGVILDYTMQRDTVEDLYDTLIQVSVPERGSRTTGACELVYELDEKNATVHAIILCTNDGEEFLTQKDIGETIRIEFLKLPAEGITVASEELEGIQMEVEISQLTEPQIISLNQKVSYNQGAVLVEKMERHSCYDLVDIKMECEDFMTEFYALKRLDAAGEETALLGATNGDGHYYMLYETMNEDSNSMTLQPVQVQSGSSITWQEAGEAVEIKLKMKY